MRGFEGTVKMKEKEISDLNQKTKDLTKEMDARIERKDEEISALAEKLKEETKKRKELQQMSIGNDAISELQRQWADREKVAMAELEKVHMTLKEKDTLISSTENVGQG